ncbi:MAG: transglutaminase family protein, partial [Pseudomonadota bacterium]
MIVMLTVHYSRAGDLARPDLLTTSPPTPIDNFRDGYGNWCARLEAPAGLFSVGAEGLIRDSGRSDPVGAAAPQHTVPDLPAETLSYLLPSRYCESDLLSDAAWSLFGATPPGWARVQAVCDFVHAHVAFGYEHSRATRTAAETFAERRGVCR